MKKLYKVDENRTKKFIEQRNFYKLASKLIDYGLVSTWLANDDFGADFIAINHHGKHEVYPIQLKSKWTMSDKYLEKGLYIAFPLKSSEPLKNWVIVPHDSLVNLYYNKSDSQYKSIKDYCQSQRNKGKQPDWSNKEVNPKYIEDIKKLSILDEPLDL